jgi:cysteine-rich repeat protein
MDEDPFEASDDDAPADPALERADIEEELAPVCGDGILDAGEECDDGNDVDWDGCTGCLITEFQVNTDTLGDQEHPSVAMWSDGGFAVIWVDRSRDGDGSGCFGQRHHADGRKNGTQFKVNAVVEGEQVWPVVVTVHDGGLVVAWSSDHSGESDVYARRFDASGTALGSDFKVSSYEGEAEWFADMAIAGTGVHVVVWASESMHDHDYDVHGQRFGATGTRLDDSFQVNVLEEESQMAPCVGMATDGRLVVAWTSRPSDYVNTSVHARLFDARGHPVTSDLTLESVSGAPPSSPALAVQPDGRFVLCWQEFGWETWPMESDISCQQMGEDGSPASTAFCPHSNTGQMRFHPAVGVDGEGNFVVAWDREVDDEGETAVFARLFDPEGSPRGPESRVNVYDADDSILMDIAMTPDGRFVLVWQSEWQDGSQQGVFAQRFTASGEPRGVLPW